jgi:hypothetical protein
MPEFRGNSAPAILAIRRQIMALTKEDMKEVISGVDRLQELNYRINRARLAGANKNSTLAEFKDYLLELGLNRYEKIFLPIETMEDPSMEEPDSETWTGYYSGIKKDGNVIFPEWG